jgi:hypothetical protein
METDEGAGIQMARSGCITQMPYFLRTGIIPIEAKDKFILWMKVFGNNLSIFKLRGYARDLARHWWVKAQNY